jgi:nitrate reductase gamma subunit
MSDVAFYDFVRGPFLKLALFVFFIGIAYRFFRVVFLGLPKDYAKPKGNPYYMALKKIVIKPTMGWTFNEIFSRRAINFIGGFLFHLGFLGLTFLVPAHAFLWQEITDLPIPGVPNIVSDLLAYSALGSLIALTVHRALNPVLKLLTGEDEYLANFLIGAILFTGILATKWAGGGFYVWILSTHMFLADLLILYIPFSRLSHFVYYFLSVGFMGWNAGKRGVSF